jgi:hypothetical protein
MPKLFNRITQQYLGDLQDGQVSISYNRHTRTHTFETGNDRALQLSRQECIDFISTHPDYEMHEPDGPWWVGRSQKSN